MNGYKEMSNRRYTCIFGLNPTAVLCPEGHSDCNKCVQSLQANDELPQKRGWGVRRWLVGGRGCFVVVVFGVNGEKPKEYENG
jgi:hypothetical protein